MTILNYKLYYFLGIGGIGMSALARFFKHHGKEVCGYDKTATALTGQLQEEGIVCYFNEDVSRLKELLQRFKPEEVLVVYTPAIPKEHTEYLYLVSASEYILQKRSQVLGAITAAYKTIAIAGTHGKTTTTTLVTHILKSAGINCYAFMGGISKNYNTNLLLGNPNDPNAFVVVEADEYDRSFLTLSPYIALITSVDADHLDIYGDQNAVKESYFMFSERVKPEGTLIVKKNVDNELALTNKRLIYSLNLNTEYCADSITIENAQFTYNIKSPIEPVHGVVNGLPGIHNIENAIAAVCIAQQLGVKGEQIKAALRSFTGVKRRFDYRVKTDRYVYIDDYAHHPEELKACIQSVRKLYPEKTLTGIFQPHLFSRTRDFADAFAEALDELDVCILLEIYPAREKPMEGITSDWLLGKMKLANKQVLSKQAVLNYVSDHTPELLLTMGAGDIDTLVSPLEKLINA